MDQLQVGEFINSIMKNIIEVLNSHFKILQIVIENFTILDSNLEVLIKINSAQFGIKTIAFENVSGIDVNSEYYFCSDKSSIIIEDLSGVQMEGIKYRVAIAEDSMTFYCENITMKD